MMHVFVICTINHYGINKYSTVSSEGMMHVFERRRSPGESIYVDYFLLLVSVDVDVKVHCAQSCHCTEVIM